MEEPTANKEMLVKQRLEQDELPPLGWFNCMPGMTSWGLVELNDPIRNEQFDEEDWYALYRAFENSAPEQDHQLLPVVEKHAWLIGRLALAPLAERVWPALSRSARGNFLAGYSNHLDVKAYPAFIDKMAEADFSPNALCELAVNQLVQGQWPPVSRLLENKAALTAEIQRFVAFRGKLLNRKYKQLDKQSHRVVDVILEAALRLGKMEAIADLLARGASPDIGIWQIFSSCSHSYCALSYAIKNDLPACVPMLLDAGANADGSDFAGRGQPLLHAIFRGQWEIADLLLQRGARFEGDKSETFHAHSADEEMVNWVRQIAGDDLPLVSIATKPQFYTPYGMYGEWYTYLTALLQTKCKTIHLRKYVLQGLDVRPTAEELAVGIHSGDVSNLAFVLEWAKAPDSIRSQILAKAMTCADEQAREIAANALPSN